MMELQREESAVRANMGDRIVINGHRHGDPDRDCEVLEVHGKDGAPPFLVRWGDTGHQALFFPGADASVQLRARHPVSNHPFPRVAVVGGPGTRRVSERPGCARALARDGSTLGVRSTET
jgi:hypothetical protein